MNSNVITNENMWQPILYLTYLYESLSEFIMSEFIGTIRVAFGGIVFVIFVGIAFVTFAGALFCSIYNFITHSVLRFQL